MYLAEPSSRQKDTLEPVALVQSRYIEFTSQGHVSRDLLQIITRDHNIGSKSHHVLLQSPNIPIR